MGREAPTHPGGRGHAAQVGACGGGGPWASARCPVDNAEQRPDRELDAKVDPGPQVLPGPLVHADLAAAAALPTSHEQRASTVIEFGLVEGQRLVDAQSRSPQHHD